MKKAIIIAATLGIAPFAFVESVRAQEQLFNILTPAAGNVQFSGQGTATFNQSLGTNNNFNVGSSTNLGVNASASTTEDFTAKGSATLNLAGPTADSVGSRLQQTIGTASQAFNTSVVTEAAATVANSIASESANTSTWGSSVEAKYGAEYTNGNAGEKAEYEAQWKVGWESEYKQAYAAAYSNVVSNSSVTSDATTGGASQDGVISAKFTTIEVGGGTQSIQRAMAHQAASVEYGSEWEAGYEYSDGDGGTRTYETQAAWQADYNVAYTAAYSAAAVNAAAATSRVSESDVKVTGIGVIADVITLSTSSFTADATKATAHELGNGNANASSGTSLSTSSFATQANSTTASAFMQAFGAGT